MRRLAALALVAFTVAGALHWLADRDSGVPAEANGHSDDADRADRLKQRIAAARRRLRDELDSVRGE
jgi:hypothetical protein